MDAHDPKAASRKLEEALALHGEGRSREALASYDAVLSTDPAHAEALHFSALLLHGDGESAEAIARIERALAADPSIADTWSNAGVLYAAVGRPADAVRATERAVALDGTAPEAWLNLSSQRLSAGDPAGSEAAARRAFALAPSPGATFNLALALAAQGRRREALDALDAFRPTGASADFVATVASLRAQLLLALGLTNAARLALDDALRARDEPALRFERAHVAESQGDLACAQADYEHLLRPDVGNDTSREIALSELTFMSKRLALWEHLPTLQGVFAQWVGWRASRREASALTPFSFLSDPSSRAEQRAAAEACARQYAALAMSPPRPVSSGRLKIGYLSADLHQHATGVLTAGLFEQHDRERFEVFAYSTGPDDGSPLRARLVAAFDRFVDARDWSDARLADRIGADGIDILVDLKGYTERASTSVMAMRPAPIAVSYLGYPGTMGAPFVDYLIGDRIVTPLAHADAYSETLVQLPHSYQVNDDRRVIADAPPRATLGLPDDAVVLCGFNSAYKIGPAVVDAWAEILRAAPDAVLWLQARNGDAGTAERLRAQFVARGVDAARLVFAQPRPHADYLALLRHADLLLDTWPYNAHTTASDALWAGCPVLTVAGETFAGRVAASLVTAVGMPGCVAPDRANYIATAVAWVADRARLGAMRAQLEASARTSPLFDTRGTTRAIEKAYREMARQHAAGARAPILVADDADAG